ncbi:MAG TPA: phosphate ABC transporter permease PstA [Acidimicrobiales bacterium]|nr:phosphate ABC transporter permease PstA [Acidimicrobiales bacterium]
MTAIASPERRATRHLDVAGLAQAGACALMAVVVTALLFAISPLDGTLGFGLVAYALFLTAYAGVLTLTIGPLKRNDCLATVIIASVALLTFVPLVLILGFVVLKGVPGLTNAFFTQTMETVGPLDPPDVGGARHAIVGTLQQVGIAVLISVPFGVLTAVFLSEFAGRRVARVIRFLVDAMSGIPSIVAGLFIYTLFVLRLGHGFSGLNAGLALSVLMLPTVTRTAEEVLALVPGSLREAALALGAPDWRMVVRVVLPTARTGLITAVVLGVARVAGETAPLLMTALGSDGMNTNPFEGQQSSLPLFVFKLIRNPLEGQVTRAWAGALVLIAIVLVLFTVARLAAARLRRETR